MPKRLGTSLAQIKIILESALAGFSQSTSSFLEGMGNVRIAVKDRGWILGGNSENIHELLESDD